MRRIRVSKRNTVVAVIPLLLTACAFVLTVAGWPVLATPGSGATVVTLVKTLFEEIDAKTHFGGHKAEIRTKGLSDVYVLSVTIAPGGQTGWHTHPGPSIVSVKSGVATYYEAEGGACVARIYPAGTGFVDPGDDHVHNLRNEGPGNLEVIGFQILPAGAPARIDAPQPANCSF